MDWEQISKILQQVGVVIENEYLPKFLDSISIDEDKTYDYFHQHNLAYRASPFENQPVDSLRDTTNFIIASSKKKSAMIGAVGGLGGFLTLIPESAGSLIHAYRCTQKLALVYGLPIKEHQKIFGLMMLAQSQKQIATSSNQANPTQEGMLIIQKFAKNMAYSAALKRLRKVIPGIGSGFGAWQGYKEMEDFATNVVHLLEDEGYTNNNPSSYSEAEEISRKTFKKKT